MKIKKRIIPNLKVIDDVVYTTKQFMPHRVTGETYSVFDYFYHTQADEVVICDISEKKNFSKFLSKVKRITKKYSFPLSIGCSIDTLDKAKQIMNAGSDKIILSSGIFKKNYKLISKISKIFGSQSIQVSIDYKRLNGCEYIRCSNNNFIQKNITEHMKFCIENGAGEIILNSVNKDGSRDGFDLDICKYLNFVDIPILLSGGCGKIFDIVTALKKNISGVLCGSLFTFTDTDCIKIKSFLKNYNFDSKIIKFD